MKVTVQNSVKNSVDGFFEYLKKRAADPAHIQNHDVIADFVDKFLVVEMKRLNHEPEKYDETIEIPDDVLLEPLRKAKAQLDKTFNDFLKGKTQTEHTDAEAKFEPVPEETIPAGANPFDKIAKPAAVRTGNGHKSLKKRNLTDAERDNIRASFMSLNGEIADDACVEMRKTMDQEVAIFQVTGFTTYLHKEVASGHIDLRDMNSYLNFLQKHRNLWATYNSPKYAALRTQAAARVVASSPPALTPFNNAAPKLAAGFPKRTFSMRNIA